MRVLPIPSFLVFLSFATFAAAQQQDPPLERGFMPDKAFQSGDIDHVDLSSGMFSLVIPVGQDYPVDGGLSYGLKVSYHSDVWDVDTETVACQNGVCTYTRARPNRLSNAGLGFMISLGRLLDPDDPWNLWGGWRYVTPDGGQHLFEPGLHNGENDSNGPWFSRDGTYLRMKQVTSTLRTIEFPDGTSHSFTEYDVANKKWRLTGITDRFGNWLTVGYETYTGGRTGWRVVDSRGRNQVVTFRSDGHVDYIDVTAFRSQTARYSFSYAFPVFSRNCLDDDPNTID